MTVRYLLHHYLRSSADAHPEGIAVVDGDRTITYEALEAHSNRLAALLVDAGVKRGDRVGIFIDKSIEAIVSVYGALKAGSAYVPIDPDAPARRMAFIMRDCGIRVLLTASEKFPTVTALADYGGSLQTVIFVGDEVSERGLSRPVVLGDEAIEAQDSVPPADCAIQLDLAYLLYTSGSTGEPKGVMLSHLNAMSFVDWADDAFDVSPSDHVSSHAPLHFDLSVFDLFVAARAAARLVLVPREFSLFPVRIANLIAEQDVTVWYSVPSALIMIARRGNLEKRPLPSLRTVLFAGEVFPVKHLQHVMSLLPRVEFHNLFGPTETNVCTSYRVPPLAPGHSTPIPIGRPISNVETVVMGPDGQPVKEGDEGELWVRGSTVMQGYWGDPDRSERALVANPFNSQLKDPFHPTGDLVRRDNNGDYIFLGRKDSRIKSRGYRIELGEIENAIYAHPGTVECAVAAVPDDTVTNRIHAYVVGEEDLDAQTLMKFCAERLPRHMIPETFNFRDALPKTSTGKVDRRAL